MPTSISTNEVTATRKYDVQAGLQNTSRQVFLKHSYKSDKVNGGFLTLPDGSRFRRTTAYSRSVTWSELGKAQKDRGVRRNIPSAPLYDVWLISSPGGWMPDTYRSSIWNNFWYGLPDVGFGLSGLSKNPDIPTMSRNEAVTKALNKLADQSANLGENLATLGQTMRMLRSPVTALVGGLKSVWDNRTLRPYIRESFVSLQKKGLLNAASEKYLEYVYGWKPLMQDIHGLIALAKERGERPLMLSAQHTAKRKVGIPFGNAFDFSGKCWNDIWGGTADSKVRCKLYARIDPNWSGTRTLNQLGLANPVALAWELTTMSFVVDWLLPIGPVLNAMSAPAGLAFVNGSISNRLSATAEFGNWTTIVLDRANVSYERDDARGTLRYEGYTRQELVNWPLPGFWIDPDPLRSDRSLKALALLILEAGRWR